MRAPESAHAEKRGRVRYRSGGRVAVGRLAYWPTPGNPRRSSGAKARVIDGHGNWQSIDPADIELLDTEAVA